VLAGRSGAGGPDTSRPGEVPWQTAGMGAGLRVAGGGSGEPVLLLLHGLGATGDVWQGWREQHGRWRLAMDPGAFAVGAPDMAQLLARSVAPVMLARGEHDAMNTGGQLAGWASP
jgi:hypothetical protein